MSECETGSAYNMHRMGDGHMFMSRVYVCVWVVSQTSAQMLIHIIVLQHRNILRVRITWHTTLCCTMHAAYTHIFDMANTTRMNLLQCSSQGKYIIVYRIYMDKLYENSTVYNMISLQTHIWFVS